MVATARKIVTIAWHMLKENQPYRYAQPKTTEAKFSRLRIRAGQAKKKGGYAKGSKRPDSYGSGVQTRAVAGLDDTYAAAQLPAIAPLKPGELAMLDRSGAVGFAAEVRKSKRIPRRTTK